MIFIAHRGLLQGPNSAVENSPESIDGAINLGFDVEVDVRYINNRFYLGHDEEQFEVNLDWFFSRENKLWIHCKNVESLLRFKKTSLNYFWHEQDTLTLTSKGFIWVYPGKQPIKNSIAVMPEINNDPVESCFGVCTDYPILYREKCK